MGNSVIANMRRAISTLLKKTATTQDRVSEKDVARIYQSLLNRAPENATIGLDQPLVDYILSIATSPERSRIMERQFAERFMDSSYVWTTKSDIGYLVTYVSDMTIGESIRRTGRFEEADISSALAMVGQLGHSIQGSTFLDIGANIGTHSLYALKNGFDRALCVEADSDNFRLLRINQILNDVDHRCVNFLAALSDRDGIAELELSPSNFGDHRVRSAPRDVSAKYDEGSRQTRRVDMKRLDSLMQEASIEPRDIGVAWIDTQGHEGQVLAGAGRLLDSGVPIVTEFWPYGLERSGGYKMFRDVASGKRIYDLRRAKESGELHQIDTEKLDELYQLFLKQETGEIAAVTDLILL